MVFLTMFSDSQANLLQSQNLKSNYLVYLQEAPEYFYPGQAFYLYLSCSYKPFNPLLKTFLRLLHY